MKEDEDTSAVEGVGSREQGNIQTHGESNSCKGKGSNKEKHRKTKKQDKNDYTPRTEDNKARRQKRNGQWRRRQQFQKEVERFKNSAAKDRLKSAPTHEDLMKVVRKENRFAKETDKQEEVETKRKQLMEHQRKRAVTFKDGFKDWKRGGTAS